MDGTTDRGKDTGAMTKIKAWRNCHVGTNPGLILRQNNEFV